MRDIIEPQGPPDPGAPEQPRSQRLAWFAAIAVAGAVVTALAAYALKAPLSLLQ